MSSDPGNDDKKLSFDTDDFDVIHAIAQEDREARTFFKSWKGLVVRLVAMAAILAAAAISFRNR